MANKYKAPIGGVPSTILKLLLSIAGAFTKRITHVPSRQIVDGFLEGFTGLVRALSDVDPNDEKQIKAVVNTMLTTGNFHEGTKQTILSNINKVKSTPAKEALFIVVDTVYNIGDILTDDLTDDGAQLETLMADFIGSDKGVVFITSLLKLALDEDTANLIALILIEALKGVVSSEKEEGLEVLRASLPPV